MKTIIYGGAFNPPTVAHQLILNECTELAYKEDGEVWLLPSGNRTDKTITVPEETRLNFLNAMAEAAPHTELVKTETLELHRTINVETYDTMLELTQLYPDRDFHWVFGSDSTQTMAQWDHGEWIIENAHTIIVNRTGYSVNPALKHVTLLNLPESDISSTLVRNRAIAGEDYTNLVLPSIHKLVELSCKHLYAAV